MELKKLPFDKNEFTANGKVYKIKNTLTVSRFNEFEKLQNHYGFGLSFESVVGKLNQSIDMANKGKGVEAWNIIYNLKEGIASRLEDRSHPALLLCSLFIVTDDEDLTSWNEKEQRSKIEDWNREGYDVNDFFVLASNLVTNFLPIYGEIFQSTSKEAKGKSKPGEGK
jgi:hypothetical protein